MAGDRRSPNEEMARTAPRGGRPSEGDRGAFYSAARRRRRVDVSPRSRGESGEHNQLPMFLDPRGREGGIRRRYEFTRGEKRVRINGKDPGRDGSRGKRGR